MPLKIFNTLTKKIEEFIPLDKNKVTIYTCGPTVYNYPHIGNLRTFICEDLLRRWLKFQGYNVFQVMNITDVDDKTIKNSILNKMTLKEYTDIYKKAFFDDLKTLNIESAELYPCATDHINDIINMISTLIKKGYAYETDDGVYFDVSSFKNYGELANINIESLKPGASGRLLTDEYTKESVVDFALWKKWTSDDGPVKWNSPFGEGRPGWHIECSVMSMKYLGETIDIHAGGVDLIFPHHTNEIAQSEAFTNKKFVNYWFHITHLIVNGEKMSKSKGNFYTLRDLLQKGISPRTIRYALLTTHYRKPLNFTFDLIKQAESSIKRIEDFLTVIKNLKRSTKQNNNIIEEINKSKIKFIESLDDDLNISEAMASLFNLITILYENVNSIDINTKELIINYFNEIDKVLGLNLFNEEETLTIEEINLIEERKKAKQEKNYEKADQIRKLLFERGLEIKDTKDGFIWKRIKK